MTTPVAAASPAGHRARRFVPLLSRPAAFWMVGVTVTTLLAASSAPSPLYPVYQAEFGFTSATLTAVFAVYVLALLLSLLTVGRLSDFVGRRPVLAVALVVQAAAMVIFLGADGTGALFAARTVQGLATGAAIGVLGAYLLDLQPPGGSRLGSLINSVAATGGLGVGAVLAGLLLQYGPQPTRLIFEIFVLAFVVLAAATAVLPETVRRRPVARAALRPRVSVPVAARGAFWRSTPTMVSTWMLGGLMLSVGGSLLAGVFGQQNHAVIGAVLGSFAGAAALASTLLRHRSPEFMTTAGSGLLVVGAGAVALAVATASAPLFVVGTVVAGTGFGPAFLGAFRSVSQLAADHERAALISAIFVVSYLAFSIPAVVAGILIAVVGLAPTTLGYAALVTAVAAGTLLDQLATRRRDG
ncbi:MFS transporter [Nakamurella sp.]|uniref:MFS transporter n=1 Tax=Nakamurella sp. TaxID=1869182 RepID=UPI003784AB32